MSNTLLNLFGQLPHQTQTPADPAATVIETSGQLIQGKLETLVKLAQQPPLLDRAGRRTGPHRSIQHQRIGFRQLPAQRSDRVPAQPPQGAHALVAIDDDDPVVADDHHDRDLLTQLGQRGHQPTLPHRRAALQPRVAQVQLM